MKKPKIYIDGKEGTTGLQIYERLGERDDIELLLIDEEKRKDVEKRFPLSLTSIPGSLTAPQPTARRMGGRTVFPSSTANGSKLRLPDGWPIQAVTPLVFCL